MITPRRSTIAVKSVKKIIHEKECDIGTDHQCKVGNV